MALVAARGFRRSHGTGKSLSFVGRIEMSTAHERTAIARAEFFLALAEQCPPEQHTEFEAFLEAAIVFARAALHRLKGEFESHPSWKDWFAQLKGNPSVEFFREHRDFLLKEASPNLTVSQPLPCVLSPATGTLSEAFDQLKAELVTDCGD